MMFCYCCLLCGNVYVVRKHVPGASPAPDRVPDWSPMDNTCPVCGGLAFPCNGARDRLIPSRSQVDGSVRAQS